MTNDDYLDRPSAVAKRRSAWRDTALSDRHRLWGWNVPAADADFIEYDFGVPVGLIEYKHERAQPQSFNNSIYRTLIDFGSGYRSAKAKNGLPVFFCRHAEDFSWWKVIPMNEPAQLFIPGSKITLYEPEDNKGMTEREWVSLMYKIRGRQLPENLKFNETGTLIPDQSQHDHSRCAAEKFCKVKIDDLIESVMFFESLERVDAVAKILHKMSPGERSSVKKALGELS